MKKKKTKRSKNILTLGVKVLIGVSVASNLFIGGLLYVNLSSNAKVTEKVNEVIEIREDLSTNLRAAIVELQSEFLDLPGFFETKPTNQINQFINSRFTTITSEQLSGREKYKSFYNRKERRDLGKNKFVVQKGEQQLFVSKGIFNDQGEFTDVVARKVIASDTPEKDLQSVNETIARIEKDGSGVEILQTKIFELGSKVADVGLKAENTRNEILSRVEAISALEKELTEIRQYQEKFSVNAAIFAVVANMAVLFFLVRWIIENPLSNLTRTIDEIRSGESPEIPFKKRKDQIGILSGAIENFREALSEIQHENKRKGENYYR